MKYSIYSFLIIAILAFSSCAGGDDDVRPEDNRERGGELDRQHTDCYEFVYPISFILPDGSKVTGNDEASIGAAIRAWYADNPNSEVRPTLEFPVDVIIGEAILTLENHEDLRRIEARCHEDHENCYEFSYPITYIMPDGSAIIGANEEEIGTQIRAWYEAHPDAVAHPTIQFPVDIIIGDEILTLENEADFRAITARCDDERQDFDCPDLGQNIGDVCRDADGNEGVVNSDCVCE
ncbi:MAG: hypothetical protein NXI23_02965 [Bacteroidetes bacterium]|nr:hypothetical protein [Bacteroidota bacterium]